jgi:hypothetical protein
VLATVHKHMVRAALAALVGLLAAAPADAAQAPRIEAAYAVDADRDGHVDAVSLRWSRKVRGGFDWKGPFALSVRGYRVTHVADARGRSQRLRVAERGECDAGGAVRVAYRAPGDVTGQVRPARGRRTIPSHALDMRRFDPPFPRITCAVTLDSDGDAQVDGVRVTYSRAVRSRAQRSGRFLFSVAGYRVAAVDAARGRFLRIRLAERDQADSGATPAVAYARPARARLRRFAVRAGRRGHAFTGTFQATRDGVSPALVAGRTADADGDGLLDAVGVRFSEPVRGVAAGAFGVLGLSVRAAHGNGADATVSVVEGGARSDARPGVWIAETGITDAAGNPAVRGGIAPADGAQPVMVGALTQDTGGVAGHIDTIAVGFSEPVAHARDGGGAYPFLVSGRRLTLVDATTTAVLGLRLAEASAPDTGERPSVRLIPGSGLPLRDAAGNEAAAGFVTAVDGVAPVLMSATTGDADSDGRLDRATVRFSEAVLHGREASQTSFAVAGYEVESAGAAAGADVALSLAEAGAADSGARPAVSYVRDGVEDVRDDAGNATSDTTLAQAADGARPVPLAVRTADADDDGRLDRLVTTWSEPLAHAGDEAAPFAVSAAGFPVTRVQAADGQSLAIDLAEPAGHDTGSTPTLAYGGGAEAIRDANGLEPPTRDWAGLTADALAPRLVAATTLDEDGDGSLDAIAARFSETVVHPDEPAPASFAAAPLTVLAAAAAAGDIVKLSLSESPGGNTGLRPAVGYAPDGTDDVRDAAFNLAAAGTVAQAADGARPVMLDAATVDADDDGRLDRVSTSWSEPLDHSGDDSAPFPLALEQLSLARVRAAAGQSLDLDLTEPDAADTGSAPDVTYAGGADPVRDASGLEAAQRAYPGVTRDALPPRLVSMATADVDFDGRLDAVELEWSEQVTGSTGAGPYTVAGRTLAANVSFSGPTTRVPFSEDPAQHDTHATPAVAYDASGGDLHDVAEGAGDTADDAPAVATQTPLDRAAPVVVAAKTADLSTPSAGGAANGTIDALLVTFSEPIAHAVDGLAPFSLNVAGRTESSVEGDTGATDRALYVAVGEAPAPDGGETPNVSVVASGPASDRIKDRAAAPNDARAMTFTGTSDEVSPVLLSAQLGERGGADGCTKTAVSGIDGEVDCFLTTWSEEVTSAGDADGAYSLAASGWGIAAGGFGALGPATVVELPLTSAGTPDRDRSGTTVTYDRNVDAPVVDDAAAANNALSATVPADAACRDTGREPNDAFGDTTHAPLLPNSPAFERKCAFDTDWFRVTVGGTGDLEIATRPVSGIDVELALFDSLGGAVAPAEAAPGGPGEVDRLQFSSLAAETYWARVTADDDPDPAEGAYCLVYSNDPTIPASCGLLAGQIVFTEVGLGADKFIEIKNDADVPVDMEGANAKIVIGEGAARRECNLVMPESDLESVLEPDEHVLIESARSATSFGCGQISSLGAAGEYLEMYANGAIDSVPFAGIIDSPLAAQHSLQFVEKETDEDHQANDSVATRWCRTFTAHTKGSAGDGCDEYRINEVLWRPASTAAASDGKAFVEIAGNIPALASSQLLGGWVVRGVNGLTGDGTADFVLPASASPRSNGTYVVADGVGGATQVAESDRIWNSLDLNSPAWPDGSTSAGPRGIQLLTPNPPSSPPCTSSADAFGWTTTAEGFTIPLDDLRACPAREGQEYTSNLIGASAARDNLSSAGDATYNEAHDSDRNRLDFCPQATPNPGQLNVRPSC